MNKNDYKHSKEDAPKEHHQQLTIQWNQQVDDQLHRNPSWTPPLKKDGEDIKHANITIANHAISINSNMHGKQYTRDNV